MSDQISMFDRALDEFGRRVRAIGGDQWDLPTPDEDWSVHDLVQHLVSETVWAPPLLAGETIEEVGDRFEGDLLGDDPKAAWEVAAGSARGATSGADVLDRTVHVSFGEISGREYLTQVTVDLTVHAWDLARAIGADEELDAELVELAFAALEPQVEQWRAAGAFGSQVEAPPGATRQVQLLALTGRVA